MTKIVIGLPQDRTLPGSLHVEDAQGRIISGPWTAYGKADSHAAKLHGNPERDPTRPYGDTPDGEYGAVGSIATGADTGYNARSYGTSGAVLLAPRSGAASVAKANGRYGLMIHGGALSADGRLRPTNGCVRLSDESMAQFIASMAALHEGPAQCLVLGEVAVSVLDPGLGVAPEEKHGELDPPPGLSAPDWSLRPLQPMSAAPAAPAVSPTESPPPPTTPVTEAPEPILPDLRERGAIDAAERHRERERDKPKPDKPDKPDKPKPDKPKPDKPKPDKPDLA